MPSKEASSSAAPRSSGSPLRLEIIRTAAEVNALAERVSDSGGVVVVPAFTGLGAPHWDSEARGAILGLTRGSTGAHLARATLEGIAFQVADLLGHASKWHAHPTSELRVDGGAAASALLMQFQADLLGVRVTRPANLETTALGAALLAGLAVGVWRSESDLSPVRTDERTFAPRMRRAERERRRRPARRRRAGARMGDA